MKHSVLLALLLGTAILLNCSDETTVEPEPAVDKAAVWRQFEADPMVPQDFVGLQVGADDMMALSTRTYSLIDEAGKVTHHEYTQFTIPPRNSWPFVGAEFFLFAVGDNGLGPIQLVLSQRVNSLQVASETKLPLSLLDPALSSLAVYADDPYSHQPVAVANDAGLMMVQVIEQEPEFAHYLYVVQLTTGSGSFPDITTNVVKRFDRGSGYGRLLMFDNRFFYSTVSGTFEILPDGTFVKRFDHRTRDMITYDGRLVASTSTGGMLASADNGVTWEQISYETDAYTLFEVDGRLCELGLCCGVALLEKRSDIGDEFLYPKTLATDGVSGDWWRAAVQYGSRVYIATSDGLFYKPVSHFFTPRHAE